MPIREATPEDFDRIWPFFHAIVAAGETFAYPPDAQFDPFHRFEGIVRQGDEYALFAGKLNGVHQRHIAGQ